MARKPSADSGVAQREAVFGHYYSHKKMRISLPAVLAFLCGFAATVVVVQHRVPALGALHLDGTHSPHHLRAKPQPPAAVAAPRSGLLDKLRAELPAARRASPPPTGAAPSAQERREAERLEAERRAVAEVAAAREAVAREAAARPKPGSIGGAVAAAAPRPAAARPKPQLVWHEVKKAAPTAKAPVGKHQKPKLMCDNVPTALPANVMLGLLKGGFTDTGAASREVLGTSRSFVTL